MNEVIPSSAEQSLTQLEQQTIPKGVPLPFTVGAVAWILAYAFPAGLTPGQAFVIAFLVSTAVLLLPGIARGKSKGRSSLSVSCPHCEKAITITIKIEASTIKIEASSPVQLQVTPHAG